MVNMGIWTFDTRVLFPHALNILKGNESKVMIRKQYPSISLAFNVYIPIHSTQTPFTNRAPRGILVEQIQSLHWLLVSTILHPSLPQCPLSAPAPPSPPRPIPALFPPNHGRSAAALALSTEPKASVWPSPGLAQSHAAPVPRRAAAESEHWVVFDVVLNFPRNS